MGYVRKSIRTDSTVKASSSDSWVILGYEQIKDIPIATHISETAVTPNGIYLDYQEDGRRVILEYYDFDHTGHIDMIRKCVAPCESDNKETPDIIYELEYDTASGESTYKKYDNRRIWLGFLRR